MAAILTAFGIFISQSIYLPIFPWPFICLFAVVIHIVVFNRKTVSFNLPSNVDLCFFIIICALLVVLVNNESIKSVAYLISSMLCLLFSAYICRKKQILIINASILFLGAYSFLAIAGLLSLWLLGEMNLLYSLSDSKDYIRFRGLSLEPNHLGFSLNAVYILFLFFDVARVSLSVKQRALLFFSLFILMLLTVSPLQITVFLLISLIYGWTTPQRKTLSVLFFCTSLIFLLQSERFAEIASGNDNSANLRTWGSFYIAKSVIDKCGILGCGLGTARSVLSGESLMHEFAAQQTLVLPNLLAGALVEGGYIFAAFFILTMLFVANLNNINDHTMLRCRISCFLLLFIFSMTGSYPYDPQFWSVAGLMYAITRQKTAQV